MKKIAVLTSVLALVACGGGSGGDLSTAASNARVTGMNSFIVVGGSNPTVNPNARSASPLEDGGTQYDLEDVTFKTIPTSGVISDLVFHTNGSGKIKSIEFADAENLRGDVFVGPIKRRGNSNVFVAKPDQLEMEQKGDIPIEYITYAKQLGLTYSDFGVLRADISALGNPDMTIWDMPFAGGYNVKKVDNDRMNDLAASGDIVFSGLAKGMVSYQDKNEGGMDIALPGGLTDEHATLTFAHDGKQILAANFENWARIEAVKAANETNQFKVLENYLPEGSPYRLNDSPAGLEDGEMNQHSMTFKTGYYGDDNAPIEGVGLVQYQYMWDLGEDDYIHHINVDLGFGGTKTE